MEVYVIQDYIGALSNFPTNDGPALLSLPYNIQVMQEQVEANNALMHLSECDSVVLL